MAIFPLWTLLGRGWAGKRLGLAWHQLEAAPRPASHVVVLSLCDDRLLEAGDAKVRGMGG